MALPYQTSNKYLAHIDGLRGIAVLAVVLFHLDIDYFSGGFIGVDIFFVISGFLITSHILNALEQQNFRFHKFYGRRIRRLMPALVFTLLVCLAAGYLLFSAPHFERQGGHSLQALLSVANISFWLESGYFDSSGALKPLLHTWSLSVEEQFYLVWPAILLALGLRRFTGLIILALGVISLTAAEYWLGKDPAMVFFLMPFRVVEFCLGALLCWMGSCSHRRRLSESLAALGLLLILVPVFYYDESIRFPGITAVVPCIGAALLIHVGGHTRIGSLLQNRFLLFFGLISYSFYLVHWPLVVFYKYVNYPSLHTTEQFLLFIAAVVIAALMYKYVETPFRKRNQNYVVPTRYFAPGLLSLVVVIAGLGWSIKSSQGWQWRHSDSHWSAKDIEAGQSRRYAKLHEICNQRGWDNCYEPVSDTTQNILILGDSHAPDALNIFYQAFPNYHYVIKSLPGGCPPITATDIGILSPAMPDREACIAFNQSLFTKGFLQPYDTIIISVFFQWYKAEHLAKAIDEIRRLSDAKIIVLGNYIALKRDMADLHNQQIDPRQHPEYVESFALYEGELQRLSKDRFTFVSKKDLFCHGDSLSDCRIYFDETPFVYDQHHLSFEASSYAANELRRRFKTLDNLRNQ